MHWFNSLREDRFKALVELFGLSGIRVVSPQLQAPEWPYLRRQIESQLGIGLNVLYVEPDASVNLSHPETLKGIS